MCIMWLATGILPEGKHELSVWGKYWDWLFQIFETKTHDTEAWVPNT